MQLRNQLVISFDHGGSAVNWQSYALLSLAPNIRQLKLKNHDHEGGVSVLLDEHFDEIVTTLPKLEAFRVSGYEVSTADTR